MRIVRLDYRFGPTVGKPRAALTLVELLAACVLASLLTAAIVGVLQSMYRQHQIMVASDQVPAWQVRLEEQLRWDFAHARRIQHHADGLTLIGYGGRNQFNGRPTHRPTEVRYRTQTIGGQRWLVRMERHLDEVSNRLAAGELVAAGIHDLYTVRIERSEDRPLELPSRPKIHTSAPMPGAFRCLVLGPDQVVLLDFEVLQFRGARG